MTSIFLPSNKLSEVGDGGEGGDYSHPWGVKVQGTNSAGVMYLSSHHVLQGVITDN